MIGAKQARREAVSDKTVLVLEYAIGRQKAKHAIEGLRVGAGRVGQSGGGLRRVIQGIRDTKICDGMETTRYPIARASWSSVSAGFDSTMQLPPDIANALRSPANGRFELCAACGTQVMAAHGGRGRRLQP
jgi:hypothetical protein